MSVEHPLLPALPHRAAVAAMAGTEPSMFSAPVQEFWEALQGRGLAPADRPDRVFLVGPTDPCGCGGILRSQGDFPQRVGPHDTIGVRCSVCPALVPPWGEVPPTRALAVALALVGPAMVAQAEALAEEFWQALGPWLPTAGPASLPAVAWRAIGRFYTAPEGSGDLRRVNGLKSALATAALARGASPHGWREPTPLVPPPLHWAWHQRLSDRLAARQWRSLSHRGESIKLRGESTSLTGRSPFEALSALWDLGVTVLWTNPEGGVALGFESPGAPTSEDWPDVHGTVRMRLPTDPTQAQPQGTP